MIKPTIGRNVYYQVHDWTDANLGILNPAEPCLAFITYVHDDDHVNLLVLDQMGGQWIRNNVDMVQEHQPKPQQGGYAYWMPYQVGQAKAPKLPSTGV